MRTREHAGASAGAERNAPTACRGPAEAGRPHGTRNRGQFGKIPFEAGSPRVAIYARLGTGRNGEGLDDQILACRRAALDLAAGPVDCLLFTDLLSAPAGRMRPGLAALVAAARARTFEVLVVVSPDRLARDANQLEWVWNELDSRGIALISTCSGRLGKGEITLRGSCTDAARAVRRGARGHVPGRSRRGRD